MNIQAFLDAPFAVQIHLLTILAAIALTVAILLAKKGTAKHRLLGRIWVALMALTSLVSFGIHASRPPNGFSWIHGLSIFTLGALIVGVRAARRGDIARHRAAMLSIVIGGLIIAGAFTFFPGRLMHGIFFGP